MLKDAGCSHVIVGHSERRTIFSEPDDLVATKFEQCLAQQLVPILCVGETLEQRDAGDTLDVVTRQLRAVTDRVGKAGFEKAMVAYEPVWAIGTGESATPEQAEEVHSSLRQCLAGVDEATASATRILYGGSVTPENAASLFKQENIDGALVGGAALKGKSFVEICRAANQSVN
jgi:triosephosphate isomerase